MAKTFLRNSKAQTRSANLDLFYLKYPNGLLFLQILRIHAHKHVVAIALINVSQIGIYPNKETKAHPHLIASITTLKNLQMDLQVQ